MTTTNSCDNISTTASCKRGETMIRKRMVEIRGKRSQQEMANLLGITQQYYSFIENGQRGIQPKYFKIFETVFNEKIEKLAPDIFLNNKTT